jgi:integrase/recombinase XerD
MLLVDASQRFDQFLDYERGYSKNTRLSYISDLRQFGVWTRTTEVGQINLDSVNRYFIVLKKRAYQKTSVNRKLAALSTFIHFALREGWLTEDVSVHIEYPKYQKRLPKVVSSKGVHQIFEETDQQNRFRDQAMLGMLYFAGMRVSEVVNVERSAINLQEDWIRVKGKGGKERLVPIVLPLKLLLVEYEKHRPRPEVDVYFQKSTGQALSRQQVWGILKLTQKRLGLDEAMSPHKLRHTFATKLLDQNVDLRYIQELLGHSNIATTEIYTAVSTKRLHDIYDKSHPRATI